MYTILAEVFVYSIHTYIDLHTNRDNMMGSPSEISLVDSIRITVKLMVIRTTPPRNEAAPIRA